jgi:hypothetical protein
MTAALASAALSGAVAASALRAGNGTGVAENGSQRDSGVNPGGTGEGRSGVAAGGAARYKPRGRYAAQRARDPQELHKFMARMLRAYTRRAVEEDPGLVLKDMLAMDAQLHYLINVAGRALVAQVGSAEVARELGTTRQAVHKRWGGQS